MLAAWRQDYNIIRQHSKLGGLTPAEIAGHGGYAAIPVAITSTISRQGRSLTVKVDTFRGARQSRFLQKPRWIGWSKQRASLWEGRSEAEPMVIAHKTIIVCPTYVRLN